MKSPKSAVGRRNFLKGAAAGAAVLAAPTGHAQTAQQPAAQAKPGTLPPTATQRAAENATASIEDVQIVERPGSDFMVDVFKSLGYRVPLRHARIELPRLPRIGHQLRRQPEPRVHHLHARGVLRWPWPTATPRSRASRLWYAPTARSALQHAAMAIYNAYCDQVPVFMVPATSLDATERRGRVEWLHSVQDVAATVRDYTKWDDTPGLAAALRRVGRARLQDRDDAAHACRWCWWPMASCRSRPIPHDFDLPHSQAARLASPPRAIPAAVAEAGTSCWWPPRIR